MNPTSSYEKCFKWFELFIAQKDARERSHSEKKIANIEKNTVDFAWIFTRKKRFLAPSSLARVLANVRIEIEARIDIRYPWFEGFCVPEKSNFSMTRQDITRD